MSKKKSRSNLCAPWPREQEQLLRAAVIKYGETAVSQIAAALSQFGRTEAEVRGHWRATQPLVKGAWTKAEDDLLRRVVMESGAKRWSKIAEHIPRRNAKQCRERWVNNLDSSVSKAPWTPAEDRVLIETQKKIGNRWSEIAKLLPGRPDNAVKNRWYSMLNRQKGGIGKTMQSPTTTPTSLHSPSKRNNRHRPSRRGGLRSATAVRDASGSDMHATGSTTTPVSHHSMHQQQQQQQQQHTPNDTASVGSVPTAGAGSGAVNDASPVPRPVRHVKHTSTSCGLMGDIAAPVASLGAATLDLPTVSGKSGFKDSDVYFGLAYDSTKASSVVVEEGDDVLVVDDDAPATANEMVDTHVPDGDFVLYSDMDAHKYATPSLALPAALALPPPLPHAGKKLSRRASQTSSPLFGDTEMLLEMEELDAHYAMSSDAGDGDATMMAPRRPTLHKHRLTQANLAAISHTNAGYSSYKVSSAPHVANPSPHGEYEDGDADMMLEEFDLIGDDMSPQLAGEDGFGALTPLDMYGGSPTYAAFQQPLHASAPSAFGMSLPNTGVMAPLAAHANTL